MTTNFSINLTKKYKMSDNLIEKSQTFTVNVRFDSDLNILIDDLFNLVVVTEVNNCIDFKEISFIPTKFKFLAPLKGRRVKAMITFLENFFKNLNKLNDRQFIVVEKSSDSIKFKRTR